jgi:hypothetical protein
VTSSPSDRCARQLWAAEGYTGEEPAPGASSHWELGARVLAGVRAAFGEPVGDPCSGAAIDTASAVLAELGDLHPPQRVPRPRREVPGPTVPAAGHGGSR